MDIQQAIKNRFRELPADVQRAIKTTDLAGIFARIAAEYSLRLDQNGSLQTETLLVMLGIEPPENYTDNLQRELEISRDTAVSISEEVNRDILGAIRSSLQALQQETEKPSEWQAPGTVPIPQPVPPPPQPRPTPPPVPPPPPVRPSPPPFTPYPQPVTPPPFQQKPINTEHIEQAGNFEIERRPPSSSPQYNTASLQKETVLHQLEHPPTGNPPSVSPVDHLLASPPKPLQPKPEPQKRTVDPYREPI